MERRKSKSMSIQAINTKPPSVFLIYKAPLLIYFAVMCH